MRRLKNFDESILNNLSNSFSIRVFNTNKCFVELYVPQVDIANTLQDYLNDKPEEITLYFSNFRNYEQIANELVATRSLNYFEKLRMLEKRMPYLYCYTFRKNKTNE